eukprot:Hpha_TRINITY_DN382_c0_g1::TRINITY_DN382_c0_g1_i1::g.112625::m.112625/K15085/SLC25A42; solute carrier family 25, member 42
MSSKDPIVIYLTAGTGSAVVSRTCIAPLERVKIIFQTGKGGGWGHIPGRIFREDGVSGFWRGNTAGVIRVVPYLTTQFVTNELFRSYLPIAYRVARPQSEMPIHLRNFVSGLLAGATAVVAAYPLDTVRARMAVLQSKGTPSKGIFGALMEAKRVEGLTSLYRGCWMSCVGGGLYAGIKWMTYDVLKGRFCIFFDMPGDDKLKVWHRAVSGAAGGAVAQTFAYPFDVMRRRMQTHDSRSGAAPYRGVIHGWVTIAREEGIRRGLYRGLSLNYLKTVPNVAIALSLYDVIKYFLLDIVEGTN